jgi:NAD(P)-dependent dehydrogenase (short-subunit alcohol dehydrogenase family)
MNTNPDLVLVTGGASGIGAAAVAALAALRMRPIVADIAPSTKAVDGALAWERPFDVSDEESVSRGVSEIEERYGPLYGLVNAAGILGRMHPPERIKLANWDREMNVDLRGVFLVCREAGTLMAKRGRGSIVNVASIAGMSSGPIHAYSAAKAGVIRLTSTLAGEWGRRGVRVNAVSPGFTRTPGLEVGLAAGALDSDALTRPSAMGRFVEAAEVGQAIAWLIGPLSSGVTGVNLPVDAGFLAGVTWEAYGGFRDG